MVLQIPVGNVRVVKPYVGGGFGPKCEATPLEMELHCPAATHRKAGEDDVFKRASLLA